MARSLTKNYNRVKDLDWDPTYIPAPDRYVEPTRFHLPGQASDPFRTTMREYLVAEREKENRHYALLEASSRVQPSGPDPRWMEGMKFVLANLSAIEFTFGRQLGRVARACIPTALRQGGPAKDLGTVWRLEALCLRGQDQGDIPMTSVEPLPLLPALLAEWQPTIGQDFPGYQNHVYRMVHYCLALRECTEEEKTKLMIAGAFHDLGV